MLLVIEQEHFYKGNVIGGRIMGKIFEDTMRGLLEQDLILVIQQLPLL